MEQEGIEPSGLDAKAVPAYQGPAPVFLTEKRLLGTNSEARISTQLISCGSR